MLSRVSLWVAALSAAASLSLGGPVSTLLLALAIASLLATLWLRTREAPVEAAVEVVSPVAEDERSAAMLEALGRLAARLRGVPLGAALEAARDVLVKEFGAQQVSYRCFGPQIDGTVLSRVAREAVQRSAVAGDGDGGYALPVVCEGRPVALVEIGAIALPLAPALVLRWLATARELLEQVAAREAQTDTALDSDRDLVNALADNLPMSLFVFEPGEHRLLAINRHTEREFELRRRKVVGRPWREVFDPALVAQVDPVLHRAAAHDGELAFDCFWRSTRGTREIAAQVVVLRHADGRARLLSVLARDVTEERQSHRALADWRVRLRELAASIDDTLFITDPARSQVEYISGECEIDPQQVVDEDLPLLAQRRAAEERLEPVDITVRVRAEGGLRWLRSRTRTTRLADGSLRVHGVVSDVTREREHERELERALADAEAGSRAKSEFMAAMSHEIRTPMNGVLGMTELLLGTPMTERQKRFARAVYRSAESLLEIINDVLDIAKMEAGKVELASVDFSPRTIAEDTLELLAPRAHEKGIALNLRERGAVPAAVHGDPLRLRQVLTNLVANAIKFTERGEVEVEFGAVVPSADAKGWLTVSVRDTGIGIDAQLLPRLFEPFTQAQAGMSRRYGGTGLGLAISRQLAELMGGRIEVQSQPGAGSCFTLHIPVEAARETPGAGDAAELPPLSALVVEPQAPHRTALAHTLSAWGVAVTRAEDAAQALRQVRQRAAEGSRPFDVVLVDEQGAGIDPLVLRQRLREAGMPAATRVALLASEAAHAPAEGRAGYDTVLAKPVRQSELRQWLAEAPPVAPAAGADEPSASGPRLRGRVLVVEDNPVNQEVMAQVLRQAGLEVRVAGDGMSGLEALCEAHFDLVLMDIQMPGMDGIQTLDRLRRNPGGRFVFKTSPRVPVIAVTANALRGDEARLRALDFDDYLSKPFRRSQLLAMLTRRLSPEAPADDGLGADTGAGAPEPLAPDGDVLDAEALRRLRELDPRGENKLIERVCAAFEASAARLLPQVDEARRMGDHAGVRHVAHTLKSSSASIGALALSRHCAELETMIRTGRVESLEEAVDRLCAEVQIVLKALKRLPTAS